jgi:gliding motility-associated-like protein
MLLKKLLISFAVLCWLPGLKAQTGACTTLGQTPPTAFPVCGNDTFTQSSVNLCSGQVIPVPCSSTTVYSDINPYWYKFTCYSAGTLSFTITPNNLGDDYDWQIFDITGHDPSDVFNNAGLFVVGNWAGTYGVTGTSSTATSKIQCASTPGDGTPTFSKEPNLILGHTYLLMVSHYTNTQSGYSLSFKGGTASITDTTAPALVSARASCDDSKITIQLKKKMQCSTVAADGSDFNLNSPSVSITAASGNSCAASFDMDSVTLVLSAPLPVGNYAVTMRDGTDNNTLLDNCNTPIPVGASVPFAIIPQAPTPMDSLTTPGCAANTLQLVFSKQILCSSIAPDGSDFTLSGPSPVTIAGAAGNCQAGGQSSIINVQLSGQIVTGGTYQISLKSGDDGNTIIDECGQETPAGATLSFITKDTVSAAFSDKVLYGCIQDTISFSVPSKNGVDQWQWIFDDGDTSLLQNPEETYAVFNQKTVQLIVSNGFCSDTSTTKITLDNAINASFEAPNLLCPKDQALFKNNSTGNISSWLWEFGDGATSADQDPTGHLYPLTGIEKVYRVLLIVQNALGCSDTAAEPVDVLKSCYIAVPSAFTPNGDGVNDYLYPLNAYNADNLDFKVYNRYGQLVFETRDWTLKWDGRLGGHPQPAGSYVWTLQYTDRDTRKSFVLKGVSILIR